MYFKEPLKSDLVAALRSNEYDQTTGSLMIRPLPEPGAQPVGFCCLGVACHLVDPSGFDVDDEVDPDFLYIGERDNEGLPKTFVDKWTTYTDVPNESALSLGQFVLNEQQVAAAKEMMPDIARQFLSGELSLSELNDNGATFAQIADFIEAHC